MRMTLFLPGLLLAVACAAPSASRIKRAEDMRLEGSAPLLDALRGPEAALRRDAARAMGRVQSASYAGPLAGALKDTDAGVRGEAAFALGQIYIDVPEAAPRQTVAALEAALSDADASVRASAVEALGKTGGAGVEERLAGILSDSDPVLRREAAAGLFRLRHLKRIPEYSTATVRALTAGFSDPDPEAAWRSVYAFSRQAEPRAEAALCRAAVEGGLWARLFAVRGLGKLTESPAAVKAVERALTDTDEPVRLEALGTLAAWKRGELVPAALARAPSRQARAAAAAAWATGGDLEALKGLSEDPSAWVRGQAAASLARRMGDRLLLTAFLKDPSWWVRAQAMTAAGELPSRGAAVLRAGLSDGDVRVQAAALEALGKRPEGEEAVARVLLDPAASLELRGTAVEAVSERKSLALLGPLEAAYKNSMAREFVEVRESVADAAAALAGAFPESKEAARFQSSLLEDPAASVRAKAAKALKRPAGRGAKLEASPFLGAAWTGGNLLALETEKGRVVIALSTASAPVHAASAAALARRGVYDGTIWHRLVPNFVVQGGDPRGTGWGDAGYSLRDEIDRERFERGTVGMPKAGKDTGGCQIFIATVPTPHLDGRYTVFGKVVEGMDVVDRLEPGDRIVRAEVR